MDDFRFPRIDDLLSPRPLTHDNPNSALRERKRTNFDIILLDNNFLKIRTYI